jgi:hypothetical protein
MIGKKVRVFWPVDNSWYTGVVLQYDANTGEHLLKYDDDDTEWVKVRLFVYCACSKTMEKINCRSHGLPLGIFVLIDWGKQYMRSSCRERSNGPRAAE